ncbi:MAG: 50S ribosomal protein L19 [Candidatus Gracilibacteria bacterium]|nr:50S ribosomal protein L19 [Candidatus Gracilibacteria bacterium]
MTNSELIKKIQSEFVKGETPDLKTGMEVEVSQIIKEGGKERIQKFKGIIIKTAGKTALEKTITVRKKVGAFGIEKIFPIHSPSVGGIEILRKFKVRRKNIGYIRTAIGKKAKLKEIKK